MHVDHVITKPVRCCASPPIDLDNIEDVARWVNGRVEPGLFPEIMGPEIEVWSGETTLFARIGDRIVQTPTGFKVVTPAEFDRKYAVVEWENGIPGTWTVGTVGG